VLFLAYYAVPLLAYRVEHKLAFPADISIGSTALLHKPVKESHLLDEPLQRFERDCIAKG
jgi:hypothetical protein